MSTTPARPTAAELTAKPCDQWDLADLQSAVQIAIELELSTLPPYLCGVWSISDGPSSPARALVGTVIEEEMLHMGLTCNLLAGLGGTFDIRPPTYPGGLPGGVRPDLTVYLSGLSKDYVNDVYMQIELPEAGPITTGDPGPTIGSFYDCIAQAIQELQPTFSTANQNTAAIGSQPGYSEVFVISDVADALKAIEEIKEQGEGTSQSPDAVDEGGELAHYYKFGELYNGKALVQGPDGKWTYSGSDIPWPDVYPVVTVPPGGWPDPVPDEVAQFRTTFATLLSDLQAAWTGDHDKLGVAIRTDMAGVHELGNEIVTIPLPDGSGNYLPDFKAV